MKIQASISQRNDGYRLNHSVEYVKSLCHCKYRITENKLLWVDRKNVKQFIDILLGDGTFKYRDGIKQYRKYKNRLLFCDFLEDELREYPTDSRGRNGDILIEMIDTLRRATDVEIVFGYKSDNEEYLNNVLLDIEINELFGEEIKPKKEYSARTKALVAYLMAPRHSCYVKNTIPNGRGIEYN